MNERVESAVQFMIDVANDDSHGYSQDANRRWGNPDYDCSSLVITAFKQAGFDVGKATYTGNMRDVFRKAGFEVIKFGGLLRRGDILLNDTYHTAVYLGGGQIVQASSSENGGKFGIPGDQTGREIHIRDYYDYSRGWNVILRYPDKTESYLDGKQAYDPGGRFMIELRELKKGMKGEDVKALQILLNARNGAGLTIDGNFGAATEKAVNDYARKHGLTPIDGVAGKKTFDKLLKG